MVGSLLLKGFLLGLSVAWPPGPINAEMIRRGLARGFAPAWTVGWGACTGDFLWAIAVCVGAGALTQIRGVLPVLGGISVALLLLLAWTFGRGAWAAWIANSAQPGEKLSAVSLGRFESTRGGYFLGFLMALSSPWNLTFWLAVMGAQAEERIHFPASLYVAAGVLSGATSWSCFLCVAVQWGARFTAPSLQIITQTATSALMLVFALREIAKLLATG